LPLQAVEDKCAQRNMQGVYKMFISHKTEVEKFAQRFIYTPADLRYFFVKKAAVFSRATAQELEYIKSCYPTYDFSQIID
jgi:hypothetical protein